MSTCCCTVAVLIAVINNVQTLSCYDVLGPVLRLKGTILCISFLYMSDANDQNHETAANEDKADRKTITRMSMCDVCLCLCIGDVKWSKETVLLHENIGCFTCLLLIAECISVRA